MGLFKKKNRGASGKAHAPKKNFGDKRNDRKTARRGKKAKRKEDRFARADARKQGRKENKAARREARAGRFKDLMGGLSNIGGALIARKGGGSDSGGGGGSYGVSSGGGSFNDSETGAEISPDEQMEISEDQHDEHVDQGGKEIPEGESKDSTDPAKAKLTTKKGPGVHSTVIEKIYGLGKTK